jgi:hypothetical protein
MIVPAGEPFARVTNNCSRRRARDRRAIESDRSPEPKPSPLRSSVRMRALSPIPACSTVTNAPASPKSSTSRARRSATSGNSSTRVRHTDEFATRIGTPPAVMKCVRPAPILRPSRAGQLLSKEVFPSLKQRNLIIDKRMEYRRERTRSAPVAIPPRLLSDRRLSI